MRKLLQLFGAMLLPFLLNAQMATTEAPFAFPFELDGGLIYLEGEMEGQKGNYVLDTGAPALILNASFFVSDLNGKQAYGLSGKTNVQAVNIDQFSVANIEKKDIKAYVTDISHIERVKKRRIRGLLGYSAISDKEILIDYERQEISMLDPKNAVNQVSDKTVVDQLPFQYRGHFPVVKVKIGKRNYFFGIDTGAEANVINARLKKKLRKQSNQRYESLTLQGVDPKQTSAVATTFKEVSIQGHPFNDLEFVFTDISYLNSGHKVFLDGILGAPFLKQHLFSINYDSRKLKIWERIPQEEPLAKSSREVLVKKEDQK
ncbi:MAG: retroviral-like aspartic protease family protein [Bacteroidota bacterium]